jgi:DNA-binding Lrp family transcriptional regulator
MSVFAYILIQTLRGKSWEVADAVSKMTGVKNVHAVSGTYDVIAYVELTDLPALRDFITKVHDIEWVQRTQTAIAV